MTPELEQRWRDRLPPFAESALVLDDLPLSELQAALQGLVAKLREEHEGLPLHTHLCWHEHDGYLTSAERTEWQGLDEIVASEASLCAARSGDTDVARAFYPESHGFLLRFHVLEEDEDEQYPGAWGTFNLSGTDSFVQSAHSRLPDSPASVGKRLGPIVDAPGPMVARIVRAGEWFDRGWAG